MPYMKVLSSFHHGDKTNVVVKRNGKEMKFDVQF
jgi:ribosomal protein L36